MQLAPIVLKLRLADTSFGNNIAGAAELALALEYTLKTDAAFVVQLNETTPANDFDSGINQKITERFAIVAAASNATSDREKTGVVAHDRIHDLRSELFSAILGWQIPGTEGIIYYSGGRLLRVDRARLWYQFEFEATTRIIDDDGYDNNADALAVFDTVFATWEVVPSGSLPSTGIPAVDFDMQSLVEFAQNPAFSPSLAGGVLFVAPDGNFATDKANFFYDDDNDQLQIVSLDMGSGDISDAGDISTDTISSASDSTITVNLGSDAGDDFIVGSNYLVVEGDTGLTTILSLALNGNIDMNGNDILDAGVVALDSITGAADAIIIGDGADTITLNPTAGVSFSEKNITNVGDAAVDSITADNGTTITVNNDIDLTNKVLDNVKSILFDITNLKTVHVEGQMRWNSDEGVPEVDLPGGQVTGQIFEEMLIRGKNQTGTATPDGKPVYISGASGSNPEFSLSDSDNAVADDLVALFTENVATGANGFVTTFGKVRGFDTTGTPFGEVWTVGDRIYVDTTPGDLTNVIPASDERKMCIGHVLRAHATEGVIFVNPLLTPFLTELSGVSNSAPVDKQLFGYNATNSLWEQTPQFFYDYATDRVGIGITPDEKLTIMQDADNNGLKIYGFDDEDDEFIQLSINSNGNAVFNASRNVFFNTNLGIFDDKFINFGTSIDYRMEYDAGTSQFQFETLDNDGVGTNGIVWLINDGTDDVIFKGRISSGDVVPLAMGHFQAESATDVGLIVQGAALQSVNLTEWQDSADVVHLAASTTGLEFGPTGNFVMMYDTGSSRWEFNDTANSGKTQLAFAPMANNFQINPDGAAGESSFMNFTSGRVSVGYDSSGALVSAGGGRGVILEVNATLEAIKILSNGKVGISEPAAGAMVHISPILATDIGQIIEMAASPTADAIRIQEGASILTRFNKDGWLGRGVDPTDPLHVIGSMTLAEDATAANSGKVFYFQSSGSSMGTCELNSDGGGGAAIEFAKSRGTNSAKTIIQDGNVMGGFLGSGYDSANYIQSAGIRFRVDGTPVINGMPGEITFETTPAGGSSRVINAILKANGFFGLNIDPPTTRFHNVGDSTLDGITNFTPDSINNITAGGGITPAKTIVPIQGSGGAVDITAVPQIAAGTNGDLLILEGRSDSNHVTLENGDGVHIHASTAQFGNKDMMLMHYNGTDAEWHEIANNFPVTGKSFPFASAIGSSGTFYARGGYYIFGSSDSDFIVPATLGNANLAYGAHVLVVQAAGASGGVDTVVRVSGTSITDAAVRTAADTQDLTIDDAGAAGTYYETTKKWIGQVTITHISGPGILCNYGFCKYWDNNNSNFRVVGLEATWFGGANDANPNISLIHHSPAGWTYNAGSEPTPPAPFADMQTDYNTEYQVGNNIEGAWKRADLSTSVNGSGVEGTIVEITTTANKTFESGGFILMTRPE